MFSVYDSPVILIYFSVLAFLLGGVFGSFLNCAAWRITHGESITKGRSHCPDCGHTLGALDLIPWFSWLFLKGKCRYCGKPVPARYPLTELVFAVITLSCLLQRDLTLLCLRDWILCCCLFTLSLTDLEEQIIPDRFLIIPAVLWFLWLPFSGCTVTEILLHIGAGLVFGGGILLVSILMDRILKKESLGGGDIKLLAVIGLYLGFIGSLFALLAACLLGLLFLLAGKRQASAPQIPFGPSLSAAFWLMLLWGEPLAQWYLSLL